MKVIRERNIIYFFDLYDTYFRTKISWNACRSEQNMTNLVKSNKKRVWNNTLQSFANFCGLKILFWYKKYFFKSLLKCVEKQTNKQQEQKYSCCFCCFSSVSVVLLALTYASKTLKRKTLKMLHATQRIMKKYVLGFTQRDRKRSKWIREQTQITDVIWRVKKLKWNWAGHLARKKRWQVNRQISILSIKK